MCGYGLCNYLLGKVLNEEVSQHVGAEENQPNYNNPEGNEIHAM